MEASLTYSIKYELVRKVEAKYGQKIR